jgi:hypothetical protein
MNQRTLEIDPHALSILAKSVDPQPLATSSGLDFTPPSARGSRIATIAEWIAIALLLPRGR